MPFCMFCRALPSPTFRECTAIPVFVQQLFIIHVIKPVSIRFDHQIQSTPWHNRFIVNWCDNRLPPTGLISLTSGTRLAVSYLWLNSNLLFFFFFVCFFLFCFLFFCCFFFLFFVVFFVVFFDGKHGLSTDKAVIQHVKGVKKVRSAIHQRIWKHAGQTLAEYFAFSIHRWSSVILYNVWNQWIHKVIFSYGTVFQTFWKIRYFLNICGMYDIWVLFKAWWFNICSNGSYKMNSKFIQDFSVN